MSDAIPGDQIRSIIERVQRLQEEKRTIEEDIKEVYQEARSNGFDVKVLRAVVKHLGRDRDEVAEFDAIFDLYLQAATASHSAPRATHAIATSVPTYPERHKRPANIAAPGKSTAAQSEGAAGSNPGQEAPERAAGDGELGHSAQGAAFAMPSGAGEGDAHPVDPAPAADATPRFTLPTPKPLRPHCLKPEACGGYGYTHCGSCERAAKADRRPAYDEELA